jgi:8-oxo-dGTP pyrophosphatase MutT (NUDIX family)
VSEPRPAATVVVLRDSPRGPEVLMVRRTRGASFMADAWVFPGGRVDSNDGSNDDAFANAAVRELREEAGIALEPATLVPLARWITPSVEPKRFDAHFFVAALPANAGEARHDGAETVDTQWATPRELLERHARGELKLPPPTVCNLEDLAPHATVEDALAWARARPFTAIQPKLISVAGEVTIVLPWDLEYPTLPGEGIAIDRAHPVASSRSRLTLREGRWWRNLNGGSKI